MDHSSESLQEEVLEVIKENEKISVVEVADELYNEDIRCECCGREHDKYMDHVSEVREAVLKLSDKSRIWADVDWNWRYWERD